MAKGIKPGGKWAMRIVALLVVIGGIYWWQNKPKEVTKLQDASKVAVPDAPEASLTGTAAMKLDLPGTTPSPDNPVKITHYEMAWNAQSGFNYANGGEMTTKGSLFDRAGLSVKVVRMDDCDQSKQTLAAWIKDYHDGKTKEGVICTYMGSGIPFNIKAVGKMVEALGPEYQPVAAFVWGKSYGEDQVIGDVSIKNNKQLLRGKVVRGYRLDGDLDLAIKLAYDNGIPVNVDDKLYFPDALNLSYAKDFLSAVVDYNNNMTETRKVVRNGKTSTDTAVGMDMVATWTPGDVNAVNGRGGVTIISTKIYASMMPAVGITCKKFINDNRDKMAELIAAVATAGDQIRSFNDVKKYACDLNAKIWNEQTGDYWLKYYNGMDQGRDTHLGGSMVFNLSDMDKLFGLRGGTDIYREVYNTFGSVQSKLYPKDFESVVDYSKAVDKSLMMTVVSNYPDLLKGKPLETQVVKEITDVVSKKSVHVNFRVGSAEIDPSSYPTLNEVYSSAVSASGLKVGVYGYTDNTGDPNKNLDLSDRRAASVRAYLMEKGLASDWIESKGFGDAKPVGSNATESGRAANRRVEIVLGN